MLTGAKMFFFLGEKMIVTGSGEGKQQAERQSFQIQMSKSMLRGSDFWLFGEAQALWTAVESLVDYSRVNVLIIGSMYGRWWPT
jgi:hypothetical protein